MNPTPARVYMTLSDKWYFAACLNTARHNAFLCLQYIGHQVEIPVNKEDQLDACGLWPQLESQSHPERSQRIIRMLDRQFPFLRVMLTHDEQSGETKDEPPLPADYARQMRLMLEYLRHSRNFYSHAMHTSVHVDGALMHGLRTAFDAARRIAKDRFKFTEEEVKHLVRLAPTGEYKYIDVKGGRKRIPVVAEKKDYPYAFADGKDTITEKGLAFFISLFLEKDDAFKFLARIKGFKDTRTKKDLATLETYTVYRMHIPQLRLESDDSPTALLLDMINELKRCPMELYDTLSAEDQAKFRKSESDQAETEEEEPSILLRRHSDRMPYFAMRYIDEMQVFSSLAFQIDLGHYYHRVYPKQIDGEQHWRRLRSHIKGYGRLQKFAPPRPGKWGSLTLVLNDPEKEYKEEQTQQPYIVETKPHYHIINNQIALKIINPPAQWPDLDTRPWNRVPDIKLSVHEIPAMLFYHLICQQGAASPLALETFILGYVQNIRQFLTDVSEGQIKGGYTPDTLADMLRQRGLKPSQVPEEIVQYLLGDYSHIKPYREKADNRIQYMLDETEELLEKLDRDIERSKEKAGKKNYRPLRPGHIADWLARDMIALQKPNPDPQAKTNEGRASSTEFQLLQARLAFYGRDRNLLRGIFGMCRLIDSDHPHSFLPGMVSEKGLEYMGITSFYRAYLIERKKFLQRCRQEARYSEYYFLNLRAGEQAERNDTYYAALAKRILDHPVNLPRGLFKDVIADKFSGYDNPLKPVIEKAILRAREIDGKKNIENIRRAQEANKKIEDARKRVKEEETKLNDILAKGGSKINAAKNNIERQALKATIDSQKQQQQINLAQAQKLLKGAESGKIKLSHSGIKMSDSPANAVFLINKYFELIVKDGPQPFYNKWGRNYKVLDRAIVQAERGKALQQKFFSPSSLAEGQCSKAKLAPQAKRKLSAEEFEIWGYQYRDFLQNEKRIRHIMASDMVLSLMIKDMMANRDTELKELFKSSPLRLETLSPDDSSTTLSAQIDFSLKVRGIDITNKNKLKNYGDFRRFAKDRRLPNLFGYLNDKKLTRADLEKELEAYDRVRSKIFEMVIRFEALMFEKKLVYLTEESEYIEHKEVLLAYFKLHPPVPDEKYTFERVSNLRNKFAHNEYPEQKDYAILPQFNRRPLKDGSIAERFLEMADNTYGEYIKTLQA